MLTINARCTSATRGLEQEAVAFETTPVTPTTPVAGQPVLPKPSRVANLTIVIYDPKDMGKYIPGQDYPISIGA